jgi:hypothetical protein
MFDEKTRRTIFGEVHQGGAAVRLRPRIFVIVQDREKAGNDLAVESLLKRSLEVRGHLPECVARGVSHPRMLTERRTTDGCRAFVRRRSPFAYRILEKDENAVDEIVENGRHLLVTAFARGRQGHQSSVSIPPVG